jgi:hypothetical protein
MAAETASKKKKPGKIEMLMEKGAPSAAPDEFGLEDETEAPGEEDLGAGMEEAPGVEKAEAATPDEMQKFSDDELIAEIKKRGLGAKDLEMGSEAGGDSGSSDYSEAL